MTQPKAVVDNKHKLMGKDFDDYLLHSVNILLLISNSKVGCDRQGLDLHVDCN